MLSSSSDWRAAQVAERIGEIERIPAIESLVEINSALVEEYVAGRITEEEALRLTEALDTRRRALKAARVASTERRATEALRRSVYPRKRRQVARDRAEKIERRRCVVLLGWLPARIGALFTYGEVAALSVIAEIAGESGVCKASIDEIASRSGTSRSTVQSAQREAQRAGLLVKTERRVPRRKSLTNVVRIISQEWKTWIARRGRGRGKALRPAQIAATGFKMRNPMNQLAYREGGVEKSMTKNKSFAGSQRASGLSGRS